MLVKDQRPERFKVSVGMNAVRNVPTVVEHKNQIASDFGEIVRPTAFAENAVLVHGLAGGLSPLIAEKRRRVVFLQLVAIRFRLMFLRFPSAPV